MRPNQAAALQLWRQGLAACRTAGDGDLDTDMMGYIALEIALVLMACQIAPSSGRPTNQRNNRL
jgi:hypothetical protein